MKSKTSKMISIKEESGFFLFWSIIAICAIEYVGIGRYIPGANRIPMLLSAIVFFATFIAKNGSEVLKHGQTKALIVFLMHTALSMTYAIVGSYALDRFIGLLGYSVLFISIYLVINSPIKLRIFIASFLIYHSFLIIVNLNRLSTTVRIGSFEAPYFLGNGNDFAWSLCIFLPFAIYLLTTTRNKLITGMILASIVLFFAGIIGTASRGALLSVLSSCGYLILNSRKKIMAITVAAILAVIVFVLAPTTYLDRMETIGAHQQDNSSQARLLAWKASINMAIGHPFGVGAGNFNSAYGRFYRPEEADQILSYHSRSWISPHSIYFLVLGEYGLLGLLTILLLLFLNYRDNQSQVVAFSKKLPAIGNNANLFDLPIYLNMSLVAFSVGGIFLGGLQYPHIFILTALIMKTREINKIEIKYGKDYNQ